MNILYFNSSSTAVAEREMITDRCADIVSTGIQAHALRLIHDKSFDAVVIENEGEGSEHLDFTLKLNQLRPRLPVFLTSDWGTELPMGLKGLATGPFAW